MRKKKLLVLLIFALILYIGIIVKIFFFGNTVYLWDSNVGKTIYAHVGNTVIITPLSPIDKIDLTNNNILNPVSGVTEAYGIAPYIYGVTYGLTAKGKPAFYVVSAGNVDISAPVPAPPGSMICCSLKVYHFKVIATK